MKLYLKLGQVVELKDCHTILLNHKAYGVGKFYDEAIDNSYISRTNVYLLCQEYKSQKIEFYYDMTKTFCTNTDNIVGIEV
nr:MAG TPA: hypothetical protein [Bacteriophage sp.]